jgi:hypothetical protein
MAWREQYDRLKRYYDRFTAIDQGRPHDVASDNYIDDIYAFFQSCYHLKDWIKNDSDVSQSIKDRVEHYITSKRSLSLCGDLCNSTKHLIRTKSDRSHENPFFGAKKFALDLGSGPTTIRLKYQIETDREPIDAFQLAAESIADWESFLTSEKLL